MDFIANDANRVIQWVFGHRWRKRHIYHLLHSYDSIIIPKIARSSKLSREFLMKFGHFCRKVAIISWNLTRFRNIDTLCKNFKPKMLIPFLNRITKCSNSSKNPPKTPCQCDRRKWAVRSEAIVMCFSWCTFSKSNGKIIKLSNVIAALVVVSLHNSHIVGFYEAKWKKKMKQISV